MEELFTLPRMAEEYTGLTKELDDLIAQGYEYASPTGGRNIQSVQMVDLEDGLDAVSDDLNDVEETLYELDDEDEEDE